MSPSLTQPPVTPLHGSPFIASHACEPEPCLLITNQGVPVSGATLIASLTQRGHLTGYVVVLPDGARETVAPCNVHSAANVAVVPLERWTARRTPDVHALPPTDFGGAA